MSDTERHDLPAEGTPDAAPVGDAAALAEATKQRDEYYDLLLRKTAEFDNYRKRIERERREQSEYVAAEVIRDLLPVLDNFERALRVDDTANADAYRKGVELVHRQMLDALQRRGVVVVDPAGADFDPHQHEAVQRVPAEGRRDGEVVEVFSRGYRLGDRLLRPAMVKVATA